MPIEIMFILNLCLLVRESEGGIGGRSCQGARQVRGRRCRV